MRDQEKENKVYSPPWDTPTHRYGRRREVPGYFHLLVRQEVEVQLGSRRQTGERRWISRATDLGEAETGESRQRKEKKFSGKNCPSKGRHVTS